MFPQFLVKYHQHKIKLIFSHHILTHLSHIFQWFLSIYSNRGSCLPVGKSWPYWTDHLSLSVHWAYTAESPGIVIDSPPPYPSDCQTWKPHQQCPSAETERFWLTTFRNEIVIQEHNHTQIYIFRGTWFKFLTLWSFRAIYIYIYTFFLSLL